MDIVSAARDGDMARVQMCLEQGVPIDTTDAYGRTALRVGNNHLGILGLLLENHANVNASDHAGQTALFGAVYASNYAAAKLLLDKGADVHVQDKAGQLPTAHAWGKADYEMLEILYRAEPEPDVALAALMGDMARVKQMQEQGTDIDARNMFGETALTAALRRKHEDVAHFLIASGADINLLGRYCSPLVSAIQIQSVPLIENLIRHGADVNGMTDYGSPLMAAVTTGDINLVRLLLDHQADIRLIDNEGYTALSLAVYDEHQKIVDLLSG